MTIWKGKSNRKASGGKYHAFKKKRKTELGPDAKPTVAGKEDVKKEIRKRGGDRKIKLVKALFANLPGKKKVKILKVVENQANRHFARRNVITKGALIKTEAGEAIVTSRPAQDGVVNAKLAK